MNEALPKRTSVSCVVITYNRDDFIDRCLTSLLEQSDTLDVRVSVINNGSSDNTAQTLGSGPIDLRVGA